MGQSRRRSSTCGLIYGEEFFVRLESLLAQSLGILGRSRYSVPSGSLSSGC